MKNIDVIAFLMALLILASLAVVPIVSASTVSNASYSGIIRVINNGTAAANITSNITNIKTADLLTSGYISSANASNIVIRDGAGNDVYFMPGYNTTEWMMWEDSITGTSSQEYLIYFSNVSNGTIRYFPGAGGMTADDDATLEPGANFSIEQKGFLDTSNGSNKDYVLKNSAIRTYISAASTITSIFYTSNDTETLAPMGAGNLTENGLYGAATNWEACLTNDSDTSYVYYGSAAYKTDLYATANHSSGFGDINSVTVYMVVKESNSDCYAKTALRTHDTNFLGSEIYLTGSYETESTVYTTNPSTNSTWTWGEVDNMEIGVSLKGDGTDEGRCTQVYTIVDYTPTYSVDITPVSSGEYTLKTYSNGTYFMLSLDDDTSWDGVSSDRIATSGASVINNSNNWSFVKNASMPYMEYQKIYVSGNLCQQVEWQYGMTFTDASGKGNNATPTFADDSSDADVTAILLSFEPAANAKLGDWSIGGNGTLNISAPDAITGMYTENGTNPIPGADILDDALDAGTVPRPLFWISLAFGVAIVSGMVAFHFTRQLLIQAVVSGSVMAIFSLTNTGGAGVIPFFTVIVFIVEAIAVIIVANPFHL